MIMTDTSEMKETVSLSVIMAAHNAETFLAEAIQSILNQALLPLEVIVVDNLSSDRTAEIATSFGNPVRCLSCDRKGPSQARNHALPHARGEWLSFLDADDLWSENTLKWLFNAAANDPEAEYVYGQTQNFLNSPDTTGGFNAEEPLHAELPGAMIIKRRAFDRVGPFNEAYQLGCVIEWGFRLREAGLRSVAIPEVVLHRRIHGSNQCKQEQDDKAVYARIVKEALDRRRQAGKSS